MVAFRFFGAFGTVVIPRAVERRLEVELPGIRPVHQVGEKIAKGIFVVRAGFSAKALDGGIGIVRKRCLGLEGAIAFDRQSQTSTDRGEFGATDAKIAEAESNVRLIGIELGKQPGRASIGGEELDDRMGIKVALAFGMKPAVVQKLPVLGSGKQFHVRLRVRVDRPHGRERGRRAALDGGSQGQHGLKRRKVWAAP